MSSRTRRLAAVPPASWREWWAVVAVGAVVVAALSYPMVPRLGTVGRLQTGDGRYSIWNVGWIDHALLTDPRHLLDANIFPHTGTLAYSELNLVAGLLGLPAYLVSRNAIAALNTAVALGLLLAIVSTWGLVRYLTGSSAAGLVAGILYTFCPYVQGHTAHIQLLMVFGVPLVLWSFHRLVDAPTVGRSVELGAALAVAALGCGYYGLFAGLLVGAAALLFAQPDRRYWIALVGAVAFAALFVAPVLVPYVRIRSALGTAPVYGVNLVTMYSADWQKLASSSSVVDNWLFARAPWRWPEPGSEFLFPGVVLLGLAAAGVVIAARSADEWARSVVWRYVVLGGLACWVSFGPRAYLYSGLSHVVPFMTMLRAPGRMGIGVALALAVIAGFAVRAVARRRWLVGALVVLSVAELYSAWPLVVAEPVPRAYRVLATLPKGVTVDFPFPYLSTDFHNHTHAMFWSTYHWQPLVNGYSDMTPPEFEQMAVPINDFPNLSAFPLMHRYNVRYVIWHVDTYRGGTREVLLARFPAAAPYLRPIVTDDDVWLYEIVGWPPGASPSMP